MKPFNLEAAKAGAPIINRMGKTVVFIAHVPYAIPSCRLVVLGSDKIVRVQLEDGKTYDEPGQDPRDLFMATTKRTVWVNLYSPNTSQVSIDCGYFYNTQSLADADAAKNATINRIGNKAYPIEIEE